MVRRKLSPVCQQLGYLHSAFDAVSALKKSRNLNVVSASCSAQFALKVPLAQQKSSRLQNFGCNFHVPLNMSSMLLACNLGFAKLLFAQSAARTLDLSLLQLDSKVIQRPFVAALEKLQVLSRQSQNCLSQRLCQLNS
jgi:hypothetical protein